MKLTKASLSIGHSTNDPTKTDETPTPTQVHHPTTTTAEKTKENSPTQTSLRIIYSLKGNDNNVDIGTKHKNLLLEMMKMDNTVHIIPNDDTIAPYHDIAHFPNTEKDFKHHFKMIEEHKRITVCHDILSNQPFHDMKYHIEQNTKHETPLLQYMKQNNIVAKTDNFHRKRMTSVGILICINPDVVHRDTLHNDLQEAIDDIDLFEADYNHFFCDMSAPLKEPPREETEEETLRFAPEFEVGYGTLSYKEEKTGITSIKVIDIQCATQDS
jgi:hypothetical protein